MDFSITKREAEFLGIAVGMPYRFKRDMPFIIAPAVGTAAAAIGAAAATTTLATVGAAAVATIGAIGAVATVAGIGMSVVGMITGDQDLMKIGGIVGLAGGVGSIASGLALGAGGLSAAASADVAAATAANTASFGTTGMTALNSAIPSSVGSGLISSANTGAAMTGAANAAQAGTAGLSAATNSALSASNVGLNAVSAGGAGLSANIAGSALSGATPSLAAATNSALPSLSSLSPVAADVASTTAASGSFFDQLLSNPTAMMSGLKMVADGVGNMGNGKVRDAQVALANAQAANYAQTNAIANRKLDADIAANEAQLKLQQQKLDDERKERERKIENWNAIVQVPTMRGVMR